jgi:galactonate dehydratase
MGPVLGAALSAVDIALWDILGQAVGKPVHQLLGGRCRDRVRVFANVTGDTLEARAQDARTLVARGYTALRTTPFFAGWERGTPSATIGTAVAIAGAIREAVGFEIDLGLEIHRNLGPDEAILLAHELAPLRLLYYEDPVAPESLDALRYVARHVTIPIATGERCHTLHQFKELLDTGAVATIRPDLSLAGGFTQCKKIAALAEAAFVGVFPHLMGSPVNLAAYVQFAAAIPNYFLMESGSVALNALVEEPLAVEDGYVRVPDRPGIGVTLREDRLGDFPHRPHTIAPATRADGAVAH